MSNTFFKDNLLQVFKTQTLCNVKFICADTSKATKEVYSIEAHQLILALNSDVFKAMFYGPNSKSLGKAPEDPTKALVHIEDIQMPIFKLMLSFIYGETFEFENVFQARDFYYAAEKYNCKAAIKFVSNYLMKEAMKGNAIFIYELADIFNNVELKDAAEKQIFSDSDLFKNESFLEAKPEMINHIFKQEALGTYSEVTLLKTRYVDRHKTKDPDIATKVRPALLNIRFLIIEYSDIVETPLLTYTEIIKILKCLKVGADLSQMPDGFKKERKHRKILMRKSRTGKYYELNHDDYYY